MKRATLAILLVLALPASSAGCIESPQSAADYAAVAVNDRPSTISIGDWELTVSRADLAFGPVYFCAAASGSTTLCKASIAEVTSVARVDGLSPTPTPLGTVHGFTGPILSASYDFGISWFDTSTEPTIAPAAPRGHSMRLEAEARRGTDRIEIAADVDVVPQFQGQHAVPSAPVCDTGASDCPTVGSSAVRLEVHFDPASWFRQLDFDSLAAAPERSIAIEPGTKEHNALLVGIKNLAPPTFRWVEASP
jgi:hypothetical protein